MRYKLIILGVLALLGVFLLRGGITGNVISQSCCFGSDCPAEYLCDAAQPSLEQPALLSQEDNNALSVTGLLIIVISAMMIYAYLRKDFYEKQQSFLR